MSSTAVRNETSVQFSLAELRDLHADRIAEARQAEERTRIEAERERFEAERRRADELRAAEERRLAADYDRERQRLTARHELELAKERARLDAEARVQEQKLALELKQVEAEVARAQAMMPRQRGWAPLLVVAVLLLGLQAGLFWQQRQTAERVARGERTVAAVAESARDVQTATGKLEAMLIEVEARARHAEQRADELGAALAALDTSGKPAAAAARKPARDRTRGRDRDRDRDRTPVILDKDCASTPLGCLKN